MTCAGAPSSSNLRKLELARMISASLYVRSSSPRMAPPSTEIEGRTGMGGTGRTVRIIQAGCASDAERPIVTRSSSEILRKSVWACVAVYGLRSGCCTLPS